MLVRAPIVTAALLALAASPARAGTALPPQVAAFIAEKAALLERGYRDEDWGGMIDTGYDVLMRVPGEPTTLKWVGIALDQLGARSLGLRALEESQRTRKDPQTKAAVAKLRGTFASVRIELTGVPDDRGVRDDLVAATTPLGRPPASERLRIPNGSEDDRARLAKRIHEIETLGGVPPPAPPLVEDGPGTLAIMYQSVEVSPGARVSLHFDLVPLGYEDFDLSLALKPGGRTLAVGTLRPLAMLLFTGPGAADVLIVGGRSVGAAAATGLPLKAGSYEVDRMHGRNEPPWATTVTVAAGEKKTLALDEPWPELELVGWKPGDEVRVDERAVPVSHGRLAVPPGPHALLLRRGDATLAFEATAAVGRVKRVLLPALVRATSDRSGLVVVLKDQPEWKLEGEASSRQLPAGTLADEAGRLKRAPAKGRYLWVPAGTLDYEARLPRYEPLRQSVQLSAGQELTLNFSEAPFTLQPKWKAYNEALQSRRVASWLLTSAGVALAALAGGGAGLWAYHAGNAQAGYASYLAARTPANVLSDRNYVTAENQQSHIWGGVSLGLGVASVICLAVGIYDLAKPPPPPAEQAPDETPGRRITP